MATREENLKKINEQLDQVAGGIRLHRPHHPNVDESVTQNASMEIKAFAMAAETFLKNIF